ncbi:hypothetical protein K493DRAFT_319879 [Basidiobolus meristosporus CBS 931.73]|uniref:Secreted protein n=1 Tax=Basidiobolus meristosporus CBS 931.73 TaxID=1314790 RepID=A0A1Y1XJJ6_9FUNG|nr:hypothetical protein K493DRAFT_319879 [Basidiobolus meristosporus CBS 931.73]|eukprot:ORX85941.1 hypothetical protein K493DRAFT_319879 [Basidiobolus meristosporus CBS 931.73]
MEARPQMLSLWVLVACTTNLTPQANVKQNIRKMETIFARRYITSWWILGGLAPSRWFNKRGKPNRRKSTAGIIEITPCSRPMV